ncbi:MAG: conjugative transposon protein TraM [Pricia sp.]
MERNKIIFIGLIGLVALFIICYSVFVMGDDSETETELVQPDVPELKEEQNEYGSKMEAVDDVREARESNAPSIYDESLLDSTGLYDPSLREKERQRIVDSIYREGRIDYAEGNTTGTYDPNSGNGNTGTGYDAVNDGQRTTDFSTAHRAFFDVERKSEARPIDSATARTDSFIMVEVNGEQTVRNDERLELRLAVDALINGDSIPRNSLVYGFVSFKANRVFIRITNIDNKAVDLKAFDLMDGNEGIYIKNSVRAEATGEVLDDIVQDINIPGVPQIGGIKQVFRRNNRNVKATIYNQYQLILKSSL